MKGRSCQTSKSLSTKVYSNRRGHLQLNLRINRWIMTISAQLTQLVNMKLRNWINDIVWTLTQRSLVRSLKFRDWWVLVKSGFFKVAKHIGCRIKLKEFTKRHFLTNSQLNLWEQKPGGNNFHPIWIVSYLGSSRNGLLQNRYLELMNML